MAEVGAPVQQSLGTIAPSSLIGRADPNIVTPQATAMLADAFRQGVISADDVISRIGQLGQTKKKAELTIAQEAISPEAIAARSQGLAANTAQGALAQAQAQAGMQNVDPAAALQAQQIEQQKVLIQYPAVAYFQKLAPAAGIQQPVLSDGTPDYVQMEKIGAELAVQHARKDEAAKELANIEHDRSADGGILFSRTKQGLPVDSKRVQRLQDIASAPLSRMAPGTAQTSPVVEARSPVPQDRPTVSVEATSETVGAPIAGGFSLGPPKSVAPVVVDPVVRAQALAGAQNQLSQITAAKAVVARGAATGPLEGSAPAKAFNNVAAAFGLRESAYEDQRDLQIVLSQKVLEGAQLMKGNLSDKDIRFLEASVPKLKDTNNTWNTFLDRWDRMTKLNVDILSGRTPPSVTDLFAPKDWEAGSGTAATPAPASATPAFNSPAEVPATTQFVVGPNGKKYVNPNYRP